MPSTTTAGKVDYSDSLIPSEWRAYYAATTTITGAPPATMKLEKTKNGAVGKKSDWECVTCSNKNYGFRTECGRCELPRELSVTLSTAAPPSATPPPAALDASFCDDDMTRDGTEWDLPILPSTLVVKVWPLPESVRAKSERLAKAQAAAVEFVSTSAVPESNRTKAQRLAKPHQAAKAHQALAGASPLSARPESNRTKAEQQVQHLAATHRAVHTTVPESNRAKAQRLARLSALSLQLGATLPNSFKSMQSGAAGADRAPESNRAKFERVAHFDRAALMHCNVPESNRVKAQRLARSARDNSATKAAECVHCHLCAQDMAGQDCKVCHQSVCTSHTDVNGYCLPCWEDKYGVEHPQSQAANAGVRQQQAPPLQASTLPMPAPTSKRRRNAAARVNGSERVGRREVDVRR